MGSASPASAPITVDGAKAALASAVRVYADAQAWLARTKADMEAKSKAVRLAQEQATADKIVKDGWWIFAAGLVGAVVGVVCVAKQYGTGGWWVLLGGGAVSILGLAMVWLGPHWLGIVRGAVAVFGAAMIVGAIWAWNHRAKLKTNLARESESLREKFGTNDTAAK